MSIPLKRYKKDFDYSYANGVFSSIELLGSRPEQVMKIIISSQSEKNEGVKKIRKMCSGLDIPFEVSDKTINRVSLPGNHLALAVFKKYRSALEKSKNHVVLVNPSDMGNIGTIARTMTGFGIKNLALIKPAVDVFDPKAVRASMGSIFSLSVEYFRSFNEYRESHQNKPYFFMSKKSMPVESAAFTGPFALVFGNESSGLPEEICKYGDRVTISHNDSIDSLNLSVAVGIALYECSRGSRI